jgi:hypothetical protein
MTGITNGDLEKLCKKFLNNNFLGVFPSDLLPKSNKYKQSIIFNLSAHDEPGSHFIAIYKTKTRLIYFDSFGNKCTNDNINKFISKFKITIKHNKEQIQDDTSSLCGYYCFYFLYLCFLKEKSLNYFIKQFTKDKTKLLLNDTKLMKFILSVIKK